MRLRSRPGARTPSSVTATGLARRRGGAHATVAVGRSILVIIWHLLADPDARYRDLGPDYVRHRTDPQRRTRSHVRQLEALGYAVTLTPVA